MGRPRIYANSSDRTKAWKLAHPERTRELNRQSVARWRARNPDRDAASRTASDESYGLTGHELLHMRRDQGGRCAICRAEPEPDRRLAIDHDHVTGAVRGLLCRRCNMALGAFGDDVDLLIAAAAYLHSRQAKP